jgi:hypothetical protein
MLPVTERVRCPFCDCSGSELVSLFGSQLLLSQYRCATCGAYFEGIRDDLSAATTTPGAGGYDDPDSEL